MKHEQNYRHTPEQLANINRHAMVGDLLQGAALNYASNNDCSGLMAPDTLMSDNNVNH